MQINKIPFFNGAFMNNIVEKKQETTGFFPTQFYYAFRSIFIPVTRFLIWAHVTPNMVTYFSLVLGFSMGVFFAMDKLTLSLFFGLAMAFSDIVDGQLAKATGGTTKFGAILDSSVDRYNDFFIYAGFALRYYFADRPPWIILCAFAFLGSVMISYVRARAEAGGLECKVGKLQRPERLSLIGIGVLINCFGFDFGIDSVVLFLAVSTQVTALYRLHHVYRQTLNS